MVSLNPTNKNIIMHRLKPFKQYIYYRDDQLDGMNDIHDNNNVFSTTSRIGKLCIEHKIYYQIQIVVLFDLNDGEGIKNTLLL